MKKGFVFLLISITVLACQNDNTVNKYVYNFTNDTITVSGEEVHIILPGDFDLVQTSYYKGATSEVPCDQDLNFTLSFSSGRTLIKPLDSTEAWEGNIGGNHHLFQECYFKIYEVDLQ